MLMQFFLFILVNIHSCHECIRAELLSGFIPTQVLHVRTCHPQHYEGQITWWNSHFLGADHPFWLPPWHCEWRTHSAASTSAVDNSEWRKRNEPVSAVTPVRKQGCRWSNEMTLLLSISSHSCCYQQAKAGADTDKTDWRGRRDDERGTEWWKIANLHLCLLPITSIPLPFNHCCSIPPPPLQLLPPLRPAQYLPSFHSLIFPLRQAEAAFRRSAAQVCGSGLPPPNETPSARFQTFSTSLAFSNAGSKVVDRERLGRGGRRDEGDGGRDWQRGEEESSDEKKNENSI